MRRFPEPFPMWFPTRSVTCMRLFARCIAAAKNKMEAYRLAQKMQADNQRLWQYNRQLIAHIYRRAPPPPPEPPEDLFD